MTDFCKECKAPLEGHCNYCTICGLPAEETAKQVCPVCKSPYSSNAIYCSKQGYNLKEYDKLYENLNKGIRNLIVITRIIFLAWLGAIGVAVLLKGIVNMELILVFALISVVLFFTDFIIKSVMFQKQVKSLKPRTKLVA